MALSLPLNMMEMFSKFCSVQTSRALAIVSSVMVWHEPAEKAAQEEIGRFVELR